MSGVVQLPPICISKDAVDTNRSSMFSQNKYKNLQHIVLLQVSMLSLLSSLLRILLKPFGQTPTVALLLAGIIFGPSCMGKYSWFTNHVFPFEGNQKLQVLGFFGVMFYLFLVGVKVDLSGLKRSSRTEWVIGISTFIIPIVFTLPLAFYFRCSINNIYTEGVQSQLPIIAIMQSTTSFHVVSCFLTDLKILNTEIGRLATSVSTISGLFSWITIRVAFAVEEIINKEMKKKFLFLLSAFILVIFITVVLRKYVMWVMKHTPKGENMKEIHLVTIFFMIIGTGYIGEAIGLHSLFGPMVFGLAIPDGKPVGSALTDKLEYPISALLLPIYFLYVGHATDIRALNDYPDSPYWIMLFSTLSLVGKLVGTVVPCLYYQLPLTDAVILGIILSTLGIFDITTYSEGLLRMYIGGDAFTVMVLYVLGIAAITSSLIYWFYNPSRKYIVLKNRTVQNVRHNAELRMLICIYNDENVPTIINLLEASNPTRKSRISIYLLHILELQGRSTPLLIYHQPRDKFSTRSTHSEHIINCFRLYEKQNQGVVTVHPFTTITHFVSAHDDVCTIAVDNQTSLLIMPFHKQWNIDGITESFKCRNVNKRVLSTAPCTVGILIDRGKLNHATKSVVSCWSTYIVGVIFLGGADDREALYYAMRMAAHPNINVVVHRLVAVNKKIGDMNEKILDDNLINEYRLHNTGSDYNLYKEERVRDGLGVVNVIRALETSYDLIMVGRRQKNYSSLLSGLMEWNEYPELGFFGDMFASSDSKCKNSVLILRQHCAFSRNITMSLR